MRIVFMGTPDFAVEAMEAIIRQGHQVILAVTQPDKPKGRGKELCFSPVKECALRHGISVYQPEKIKAPEAVAKLAKQEAELFVVAAFGQILSPEILKMPKYGCINIHASLLPKYRGAAPVQWAIINGEKESGVTIMQMDEGLDTGAMLAQRKVEIAPKETADSLHDKLMEAGAQLVVETISRIEKGEVTMVSQKDSESCYARRLEKSMGRINWEEDALYLERLVRGLNSWPGAYTLFRGKNLKIWEADVSEENRTVPAGTVGKVTKNAIYVQTKSGMLILKSVQIEGKKRMDVKDFLPGYPVKEGERLL